MTAAASLLGDRAGEHAAPRPGWTRTQILVAVVVAIVQLTAVWTFRTPAIAWGDEPEYVILSRQVQQLSYQDAFLVDSPTHARYPPGYPAILAVASFIGGESEFMFIALNAILAVVAILLILDVTRGMLDTLGWAALAVTLAISPEWILWSGHVMSETSFAFLVILCLWLERRGEGRASYEAWAAVAIVGAALVRSAGLPFVVGLVAYRVWRRRHVAAVKLVVLAIACLGMWSWHVASAPDPELRALYLNDLSEIGVGRGWLAAVQGILSILPWKLRYFSTNVLPYAISVPTVPGTIIDNAVSALLLATLLLSGAWALWRKWPAAILVLGAYFAAHVIWPWVLVRYLVPVLPLLLVTLAVGAWRIAERLPLTTLRRWIVPAVMALLWIGAGNRLRTESRALAGCDKTRAYSQPACFDPREWLFFQAAFHARDSLPADAVVLTSREGAFYYHSGRRTVNHRLLLLNDSTTLAEAMRRSGASWAVTAPMGPGSSELGRRLAHACRDFDLVRAINPFTAILRVRPADSPAEWGAACEATNVWRLGVPDPTGSRPIPADTTHDIAARRTSATIAVVATQR